MKIVSADVMNSHLQPVCTRDNQWNTNPKALVAPLRLRKMHRSITKPTDITCSWECLATRRRSTPGVKTMKCPTHGRWLYRRQNIDAEPGVHWSCGIEGCDFGYDANIKGDWVSSS
jgi:hypothetical protein